MKLPDTAAAAAMMRAAALCVALCAGLAVASARAQAQDVSHATSRVSDSTTRVRDPHAVQPERPTVATHAGTVAPGWVEIETGGELDRYAPRVFALVAPTTVKIGVARAMQLNANVSVLHDTPDGRSGTGFGDANIGLKMRLVDDAPIVGDFAVLPSVKFPTGSVRSGFGSGTTDLTLLFISSHTVGDVAVDLNAGVTRRSGDGSNAPTLATIWTVSVGIPVAGRLGWAAELFGYPGTGGPQGSTGSAAILTGPTFLLREWLAFDVGVIAPVTGPQPRAAYAGLVWNVGCIVRRCAAR